MANLVISESFYVFFYFKVFNQVNGLWNQWGFTKSLTLIYCNLSNHKNANRITKSQNQSNLRYYQRLQNDAFVADLTSLIGSLSSEWVEWMFLDWGHLVWGILWESDTNLRSRINPVQFPIETRFLELWFWMRFQQTRIGLNQALLTSQLRLCMIQYVNKNPRWNHH